MLGTHFDSSGTRYRSGKRPVPLAHHRKARRSSTRLDSLVALRLAGTVNYGNGTCSGLRKLGKHRITSRLLGIIGNKAVSAQTARNWRKSLPNDASYNNWWTVLLTHRKDGNWRAQRIRRGRRDWSTHTILRIVRHNDNSHDFRRRVASRNCSHGILERRGVDYKENDDFFPCADDYLRSVPCDTVGSRERIGASLLLRPQESSRSRTERSHPCSDGIGTSHTKLRNWRDRDSRKPHWKRKNLDRRSSSCNSLGHTSRTDCRTHHPLGSSRTQRLVG